MDQKSGSPVDMETIYHYLGGFSTIQTVVGNGNFWTINSMLPSTLLSHWKPQVHSYPQRPSHRDCLCSLQRAGAVFKNVVLAWGFSVMFPKIERKWWLIQGGLAHKPVVNGVKFHPTYRGPTTPCITGRWVRTWVISLTIPETNIALESLGLEEEFPFGKASSQVLC